MSEDTKWDKVETNRETALVKYEVDLTDLDKADKMAELVKLDDELKRIDARKKVVMSEFAADTRKAQAKISRLINECRQGFEEKEEDCTFEYNWESGFVHYFSLDTGHAVHSREITKEERQMNAFDKQELERVALTKPQIPKCHMKDMELVDDEVLEDGSTILAHYKCSVCGAKKPYEG
jgi:DNA relaxase NicK